MGEDLLYYYTDAKTLLLILEDFKIKMSVLSKSSDLVERNYFRYIIDGHNGIGETEAIEIADKYRYVCFCTEPNEAPWFHKNQGYRLPNMWDTYANRHKGACIIINQDKFIKENNTLKKKKIEYKDNIDEKLDLLNKMELKLNSYRNENEIRFISTDNVEFCSIENCVEKIILGVDFEEAIIAPDTIATQTYGDLLFEKIKNNRKKINPALFVTPIVRKDGKIIIDENGGLLWKKMKDYGIKFE